MGYIITSLGPWAFVFRGKQIFRGENIPTLHIGRSIKHVDIMNHEGTSQRKATGSWAIGGKSCLVHVKTVLHVNGRVMFAGEYILLLKPDLDRDNQGARRSASPRMTSGSP